MNKSLDSIVLRYVGFGLLFLGFVLMVYMVRGALPVFVVGGVIAFAMEPVLQKMESRGHSRGQSVGFIAVIVALIGCIFLWLSAAAFQQGQSFVRDIPSQVEKAKKIVHDRQDDLNKSKLPDVVKKSINDSINEYLVYLGDNINKKAKDLAPKTTPVVTPEEEAGATPTGTPTPIGTPEATPQETPTETPTPTPTPTATAIPTTSATSNPSPGATSLPASGTSETKPSFSPLVKVGELAPAAVNMVTALGSFLAHLFLTIIVSFGLMLEAPRIKARLLMLVPPLYRRDATELSSSINQILGSYVRGQLIVCGTFGVLCTIAFEAISYFYGMQYPLVLGAFAGVIYVLPYVGLAISFVVAGATAYFTATNQVPAAIAAMASVVVFNLTMDYYVSPRVLGKNVGLHPLMVIFALLCGFELGGPIGTVAAVPVFAALRVIAIYLFPQLAAPLPDESPQATSLDKPHGPISEQTKRVADAEGVSKTKT